MATKLRMLSEMDKVRLMMMMAKESVADGLAGTEGLVCSEAEHRSEAEPEVTGAIADTFTIADSPKKYLSL